MGRRHECILHEEGRKEVTLYRLERFTIAIIRCHPERSKAESRDLRSPGCTNTKTSLAILFPSVG
jgi:hypothetical protein